jgi:hypothetical protein
MLREKPVFPEPKTTQDVRNILNKIDLKNDKIKFEVKNLTPKIVNAAGFISEFSSSKGIHFNLLNVGNNSNKITASDNLFCFSDKEFDLQNRFIFEIFQRCYYW